MRKWSKQIPNEPGYWLRVNVGGRVQLYHVWREKEIPRFKNKLTLIWGLSGSCGKGQVSVEEYANRLKKFYWYGPMPEAPQREPKSEIG